MLAMAHQTYRLPLNVLQAVERMLRIVHCYMVMLMFTVEKSPRYRHLLPYVCHPDLRRAVS
jgi:hypothetical protein